MTRGADQVRTETAASGAKRRGKYTFVTSSRYWARLSEASVADWEQ